MTSKNFKYLIVWQKSMALARQIYKTTANFPEDEKFGLVSQMRRASVSIPSNIAEGTKRGTPKEFRRFIHTATGSAAELETQRILAYDLGFIDSHRSQFLSALIEEVMSLLGGLEKSINAKITKVKNNSDF